MTKLLIRYVAFFIILYGGIVLSSEPTIASARQNALTPLGFNRCNGAPCFLEITPGKTSWYDATSILEKNNFKKDESDMSFIKEDSLEGDISVATTPDNPNLVNEIELSDLGQYYKITLADVLELYGFPCNVESDYKGSFWFAYPNLLVHALSEFQTDYSKVPIVYILLVDPQSPESASGISVCQKTQYSTDYLSWFTF